jgi:hypothetical protein
MVTPAKITAAAVLFLALAVAIAGFVPVSHPALDRAARKAAYQAGAGAFSFGSVKAAFWTGMTLRKVAGTVPCGAGRRCAVRADRVVLRGSIIRAALNRVMRRPSSAPASFARDPAAMFRRLHRASGRSFSGMSVSSAALEWTGAAGRTVRLHGISLSARFPGAVCSGSFSARSLACSNVTAARKLRGGFSTDGRMFRLASFTCVSFGGAVRCSGRADLFRSTLGTLALSIRGFDFGEWNLHADTSGGLLAGTVDCRVELDSSALAADSLRGRGTVTAAGFGVSGFAIQRTLAGMLGWPAVASVRFGKSAALFTIKPGGAIAVEASGHNDSLSVKMSGEFRTDGRLDQKVECTVARRAVGALPWLARKALEKAPGGDRVIRLRIYGTLANPKFTVESRTILREAVQNMFNEVRDNFQDWLK